MALSFQYCRLCLKKYLLKYDFINERFIRFFIPTYDEDNNEYLVYIQMNIQTHQKLLKERAEHNMLINLRQIATILHVEKGSAFYQKRQREVSVFYKKIPQHHFYLENAI